MIIGLSINDHAVGKIFAQLRVPGKLRGLARATRNLAVRGCRIKAGLGTSLKMTPCTATRVS